MLTADLVRVRREGDRIHLRPLEKAQRDRMREVAAQYLAVVAAAVGEAREDVEARLAEVDASPQDRRVADGLVKLVLDRCEFVADEGTDPIELRRDVFRRAAAVRREASEPVGRETVLAEVARARGVAPEALDARLFADLKGAWRLAKFDPIDAEGLLALHDRSSRQAVLLKAVRVTVDVHAAWPGAWRALFHRMKFLRLLYAVHPLPDGGHRLEIDGPYSLFDQVTKYGLQLALLLPALDACGPWSLEADVLWDKDRKRLKFSLSGAPAEPEKRAARREPLPDEVAALVEAFRKLDSGWEVSPARAVLNLPGAGVCVPDLTFVRGRDRVYLEVMGYWSRSAVWRRVELAEAGLPHRIVWAVSDRLRVSEQALPPELPAALYVYKGVINARRVLEHLERVAAR